MLGALPCATQLTTACRPGSCKNKVTARPAAAQPFVHQLVEGPCSSAASGRSMVIAAVQAEPASWAIRHEPSPEVLAVLRSADAFCFDVDSTLCEDESIDEIAAFLGVGEVVAALTAKAMGGTVPFQDALAERLSAMQVSRSAMELYLASHPPRLSNGIPELVKLLQARGKGVFLVSGGFRQVINPIATQLGISLSHVFANTILYKEDGSYAGFDTKEFTSRSGGKAEAVRHICATHGLRRVVMVGDGATDLEARQPGGAEIFIGYGGAVFRPNIAEQADWYVTDIQDIIHALES